MSVLEGPGDLPPEVRAALADWLLAMIDNKKLLGLRYAEWCTGAPELEADVAVTAMAQYELGHARLLDGVLGDLPEDPRDERRDQDRAAWRSLPYFDRPLGSWTELVVANALVDTLLTVNMQAAQRGRYQPLVQRLRKAVAEERYHLVHGRAWFRRIAAAPADVAGQLRSAVERAWPQCRAWFGPHGGATGLDRLAEAGVVDARGSELLQRYLEALEPVFRDSGVEMPARRSADGWAVDEIDWEGWDEARRRHGTPQFDDESFAMLTGADARALGVSD